MSPLPFSACFREPFPSLICRHRGCVMLSICNPTLSVTSVSSLGMWRHVCQDCHLGAALAVWLSEVGWDLVVEGRPSELCLGTGQGLRVPWGAQSS